MPRTIIIKHHEPCPHCDGLLCLVALNQDPPKTFPCTGENPDGCGVYLMLKNGGTI